MPSHADIFLEKVGRPVASGVFPHHRPSEARRSPVGPLLASAAAVSTSPSTTVRSRSVRPGRADRGKKAAGFARTFSGTRRAGYSSGRLLLGGFAG